MKYTAIKTMIVVASAMAAHILAYGADITFDGKQYDSWSYKVLNKTLYSFSVYGNYQATGKVVKCSVNATSSTLIYHYEASGSGMTDMWTTEIRPNAFDGCTKLTMLTINNGFSVLGAPGFKGCSALKTVSIPSTLVSLPSEVFSGCSSLEEVDLPSKTTRIPDEAFYNCTSLKRFSAPNNLKFVGKSAFAGCESLQEVILGENLQQVNDFAFQDCAQLTELTLPRTLSQIGNQAFSGCGIKALTFLGNAPATTSDSFTGICADCVIYVSPDSSGWNVSIPGVWNSMSIRYIGDDGTRRISFDSLGGSDVDDVVVKLFAPIGDLPKPTRYGYTFVGWFSDVEFENELTADTIIHDNISAYAKWVGNPVFSPISGTGFSDSLSVSITTPDDGAIIYCTIDGSEPSIDSPVYKRFRISGKTTVKAIAEKDGTLSDVVTAEYALGQCEDPVISLADGVEFAHSNQVVSIQWNNDGVLRYTLDGSEPTAESPVYEGPFSFSDSVVIKAKVFSDDFFDSAVVMASLTRVWENVATPVIDAVESFAGSKTKVVISCATADALVRYTLNGNEPNSHSTKYTGPFYVTDSCTVKAYAVKIDYLNSAVATHAIEKEWGIGDSLGKPDHGFATEGDGGAGWTRVEDTTAANGEAMKSGSITHSQTSTLSTTIMGPGTLTFSWMTSCEEDPDGRYEWDHAEFSVDGNVLLRRDGVNSWKQESVRIEGGGEHTVTWVYTKDDVESEGDDAAWVAGYGWVSDLTETQTTDVHVPYAWLLGHDPEIVDEYDAYEAAAKVTGVNGHKVWESYVIGADPNDKDDSLKITAFPMKADGTPDLEAITISPPQSKWNVEGAQPVLRGRATLEGTDEWQAVTDKNKADMRFFRVDVELP